MCFYRRRLQFRRPAITLMSRNIILTSLSIELPGIDCGIIAQNDYGPKSPLTNFSYVFICLHMSSYVFICLHMSSYVFICLHMSSYVFIYLHMFSYIFICLHISSYVFICLHISSYVFIRLHMSSMTKNARPEYNAVCKDEHLPLH